MFTRLALIVILVLCLAPAWAAPLDGEVQAIAARGSGANAHWGVYAVDLDSGRVLVDVNGSRLFVPGSSRKLVPAAMAARQLAGDFPLQTVVHGGPAEGGTLRGDLVVRAVGDPTWNAELRDGRPGSAVLRQLARQVAAAGISTIDGDLVIDTSRFEEPAPLPPAWNWEDFQTSDGPIPAALAIDRSFGRVLVAPGRAGEPLRLSFSSPVAPFELDNRTVTGRPDSVPTIQYFRGLDGHTLTVSGSMASNANEGARLIPLGDPVRFAGETLRAELEGAGVTVRGGVVVTGQARPVGEIYAADTSAPLDAVMARMNQRSDNVVAESVYLLCAANRYGVASYRGAHAAEKEFWSRLGVDSGLVVPQDGSGLSRKNLVAPRAMVDLLAAMRGDALFTGSLAVSGRSGTLRYRMAELQGRVRAKTGTLDGVSTLTGYVTTNSGRTVAFAIMVNNYHHDVRASTMRARIDEIVDLLAR